MFFFFLNYVAVSDKLSLKILVRMYVAEFQKGSLAPTSKIAPNSMERIDTI